MSSQWENTLAKRLYRNTNKYIYPIRAGYSGNGAYPLPDIFVMDNSTGMAHALEVKGQIQSDTVTLEDADDLYQLDAIGNTNTRCWLVVKFSRRAPLTVPLLDVNGLSFDTVAHRMKYIIEQMYGADSGGEGSDSPFNRDDSNSESSVGGTSSSTMFNPRVRTSKTGVTRLYLDKPSTDEWPSAMNSNDDWEEIVSSMGLAYE